MDQTRVPESYQEIIESSYLTRLKKNPRYSLRAFARDIGISTPQLSLILRGRKGLSLKAGETIAEKLGFSTFIREIFLDYIQSQHARSPIQRKSAEIRIKAKKNSQAFVLKEDLFQIVSDWQHFAILEFVQIEGFKTDLTWISKCLGIPISTCSQSVERLFRVGLLKEHQGQWIQPESYILGPDEIKSDAVKKFHGQILDKAMKALEFQNLDEREFGNVLFTMNAEDLAEAKKALKDFRRSFSKHFRNKNSRNALYTLSMQLFRIDQDTSSQASFEELESVEKINSTVA